MRPHVKRTLEVLEALGFTRHDDPFGRRKWEFRHSFAPDEPSLKVWEGQSEAACIAVQQKAHAIAETGSSGPKMPKNAKRRSRRTTQAGPTVLELAMQDRAAAREQSRADRERLRALADEERRAAEIRSLMQPGGGR